MRTQSIHKNTTKQHGATSDTGRELKELFPLTRLFGNKCFPGKKVPTGRNFKRCVCAHPFDCPQTKPVGGIPFDCTSHFSFLPMEVRKGSKCCRSSFSTNICAGGSSSWQQATPAANTQGCVVPPDCRATTLRHTTAD